MYGHVSGDARLLAKRFVRPTLSATGPAVRKASQDAQWIAASHRVAGLPQQRQVGSIR